MILHNLSFHKHLISGAILPVMHEIFSTTQVWNMVWGVAEWLQRCLIDDGSIGCNS